MPRSTTGKKKKKMRASKVMGDPEVTHWFSNVFNTKNGLMTWMIWEVPPVWESSRRGCASAKAAKAAVSSQDGTCVGLLGCSHVPKLRLFHCREGKTNGQKHSKAHSCFSLGSTF